MKDRIIRTATKKPQIIRRLVLLTGVLFLGIGVIRQESATVLTKAIMICLECIGIG